MAWASNGSVDHVLRGRQRVAIGRRLIVFALLLAGMTALVSDPASADGPGRSRSVVVAVDADGIDVTWRPPSDSGHDPVSGYELRLQTAQGDIISKIEVTGPPTAPRNVRIVEGSNGSATVRWAKPTSDGGDAITGYRVSFDGQVVDVGRSRRALRFTGLDRGEHAIVVRARNDNGLGAASNLTWENIVEPGRPRSVRASVDGRSVTVSWVRPADDGGEVSGYEVVVGTRVARVGGETTRATISGLDAGDLSVRVRTVNRAGRSRWTNGTEVSILSLFEPFDSSGQFVAQTYLDFLGRSPDEAGLSFWQDRLESADGMAPMVVSITRAPELDAERRLARLYLALFDRAPDRDGFEYWVEELEQGRALPSISEQFVYSAEFLERFGALTNAEFVVLVYNRVLARQPDQAGFSHWVARLDSGVGRGALISLFAESPEFVAKSEPAVDLIVAYDGLLQRPPRHSELTSGLAVVATTGSVESVVVTILGGAEYRSRISG